MAHKTLKVAEDLCAKGNNQEVVESLLSSFREPDFYHLELIKNLRQ